MKTIINTLILFVILINLNCSSSNKPTKTIKFKSLDNINITADLYLIENKNAPFIILFHRAKWSRGEYLEIAPKLNKLGFNCMAVDQRSGNKINKVKNQTFLEAKKADLFTDYEDALPDVEASILYVKNNFKPTKLILWGSSYSASLSIVAATKFQKDLSAVITFSPGEYFTIDGQKIEAFSSKLKIPVFMTSKKHEYKTCKKIFDPIKSKRKTLFKPEENGAHGSEALWEQTKGYKLYWKALEDFLKKI